MPKWSTVAEILKEIETDFYLNPAVGDDSNSTVLMMCGNQRTSRQLREYIQSMYARKGQDQQGEEDSDEDENMPSASVLMRRRLRGYLEWRKDFTKVKNNLFSANEKNVNGTNEQRSGMTSRAPANKRRRIRGGGAAGSSSSRGGENYIGLAGDKEAHAAELLRGQLDPDENELGLKDEIIFDSLSEVDQYYKLLEMKDLVLVSPYDGDKDDQLLEEVKPRYIIMYEPDPAFIRRVEVYRSSHTDRNVRVYFLYYKDSVEERRFLSALRREKDAFTQLIRERSVRLLPSMFGRVN